MPLIDRARAMIVRPREEWVVIDTEPTTVMDLYRGYVVPLAAIGPVALAIGTLAFVPGASPATVALQAIVGYVLSIAMVYVIAVVADRLAPRFGGTRNMVQAQKVAAYGLTALFVTGIFSIAPVLGVLGILGLYSVYEIHTGLPVLMRAPQERAMAYTVSVIVIVLVVTAVLSIAYLAVFPATSVV